MTLKKSSRSSQITDLHAREVLDSRGNPTVEVDIALRGGVRERFIVPSGASTGVNEALELRDGDRARYDGKGVLKAVAIVNGSIQKLLRGRSALDQEQIDRDLIALDGTLNKSRLGANAILGASLAAARAAAVSVGVPLYEYFRQLSDGRLRLPMPMINIISGGKHAGVQLDVQDFLIYPIAARTMAEALVITSNVWRATLALLVGKYNYPPLVADEGGFGPRLKSNQQALDVLVGGIERAGYRPGRDVSIALDIASSHFHRNGHYKLAADKRKRTPDEMIDLLDSWMRKFPVVSIEDGLAEDDWDGWRQMTARLGKRVQLVGDDFLTTNPARVVRAIDTRCANAVLVKFNQIGTLTETLRVIELARRAGYRCVISARSGETEDTTMSDLAVGTGAGQIKIGSVSRTSRLCKYNQLLRIEESLGRRARLAPLEF